MHRLTNSPSVLKSAVVFAMPKMLAAVEELKVHAAMVARVNLLMNMIIFLSVISSSVGA